MSRVRFPRMEFELCNQVLPVEFRHKARNPPKRATKYLGTQCVIKLPHIGRSKAERQSARDDRAGRCPPDEVEPVAKESRPAFDFLKSSFSSRSRNAIEIAPRTPPPSSESIRLGPGPKRCRSRDDSAATSGEDIGQTAATASRVLVRTASFLSEPRRRIQGTPVRSAG